VTRIPNKNEAIPKKEKAVVLAIPFFGDMKPSIIDEQIENIPNGT
jgi:hypothetical protein